ncbi:DUF3173 family protein [Streptococcus devriesei]|uniref:DUF3173 family protein n=1 Tax=Streptococcus devriesei TaxID=231233 RepID=UPI0004196019|nr:DUF3173 family protein [Streptococcus devriesei]
MIDLLSKEEIITLTGYSESQAKKIIRMAKEDLVQHGFLFYNNKRVGRVPRKSIERILGFELSPKDGIIDSVQEDTVFEKGVSNDSNETKK